MNVEFNDEKKFNESMQRFSETPSGITGWFIKIGLAKNKKSADMVMIIVAIIFFALAVYFFFK